MGEKGEDAGEGWRSSDLNVGLTMSEGEGKAGCWMLPRLLCRQRRLSKAAGTFGNVVDQDFLFMNQPFPSEADVEVGVIISPSPALS